MNTPPSPMSTDIGTFSPPNNTLDYFPAKGDKMAGTREISNSVCGNDEAGDHKLVVINLWRSICRLNRESTYLRDRLTYQVHHTLAHHTALQPYTTPFEGEDTI